MEITSEVVDSLINFSFSSQAKTESAKFIELHCKWNEVYANLEEINKTDVLNHEPTLMRISKKLPSEMSRDKYVDLRLLRRTEGKTELKIMSEFMRMERLRQKTKQKLEGTEEIKKRSEVRNDMRSDVRKCHNCGEVGHFIADCPTKGAKSRGDKPLGKRISNFVDMKKPQKPCPACRDQLSFQFKAGQTLYKSRLSSCQAFMNLTPADRASMIQGCGGCAMCLDWTGDHSRDHCPAKKNNSPLEICKIMENNSQCGKKHHYLLHGSSVKYCNMVQLYQTLQHPDCTPTDEDLECNEVGQDVLMQMQWVGFEGDVNQGLLFFDSSSNINLIRVKFAEMLGLKGRPCQQYVQLANRSMEPWETIAYWVTLVDKNGDKHRILAFGINNITAEQE